MSDDPEAAQKILDEGAEPTKEEKPKTDAKEE